MRSCSGNAPLYTSFLAYRLTGDHATEKRVTRRHHVCAIITSLSFGEVVRFSHYHHPPPTTNKLDIVHRPRVMHYSPKLCAVLGTAPFLESCSTPVRRRTHRPNLAPTALDSSPLPDNQPSLPSPAHSSSYVTPSLLDQFPPLTPMIDRFGPAPTPTPQMPVGRCSCSLSIPVMESIATPSSPISESRTPSPAVPLTAGISQPTLLTHLRRPPCPSYHFKTLSRANHVQ